MAAKNFFYIQLARQPFHVGECFFMQGCLLLVTRIFTTYDVRHADDRFLFIFSISVYMILFVCYRSLTKKACYFIVGLLPLFYKLIINNYGFPHILLHVQSDSKRTIDFKIRIFLRKQMKIWIRRKLRTLYLNMKRDSEILKCKYPEIGIKKAEKSNSSNNHLFQRSELIFKSLCDKYIQA